MNDRMPLLVLGTTLLAFNPMSAGAAVTTSGCGGSADTCTMTQLLGGGEFTAGDLRFHTFSLFFGGGPFDKVIDEDTISLTGLDDAGFDPGPGFRFNGNGELATAVGETIGYVFDFKVDQVGGLATMKDSSLKAGTGSVGPEDEWRVQGRSPSGNFFPDLEIVDSAITVEEVLFDSFTFAPTSSLTARNAIVLDSQNVFGDSTGATLDDYTFRVSAVPLPAALPLLLSALGLLTVIGKRRSGLLHQQDALAA
ncbi:MAG: hypothetical protein AABZ84_09250 [Pseudomonadota bacterium]